MFHKICLLFHHFYPLFCSFLSILMQFCVNNNLHVSTLYYYYPLGKRVRPYFHYVNCTGRVSIHQHVPFRLCSCFINTIAQIIKIVRFCNYFTDCPLYIFPDVFSNVFLVRCVLIT